MNNAMQLKAKVKNVAKEKKISAQLVLQNYMLERFLERVSFSPYWDNFIIKGGFLIASMVGLDSRATMDMDATIKGYPVDEATIRKMVEEILHVPIDDGISFEFRSIGQIREDDEYGGYRVAVTAGFEKLSIPLKLDITTGDQITPKEIEYQHELMFENRSIRVLAYNLPTILAEKLETVISRGDQNTRPRDYYDIYILTKLNAEDLDIGVLREALRATSGKRGSTKVLKQYKSIMSVVKNSRVMNRRWEDYKKDFEYAAPIEFDETCDAVVSIMDRVLDESVSIKSEVEEIRAKIASGEQPVFDSADDLFESFGE